MSSKTPNPQARRSMRARAGKSILVLSLFVLASCSYLVRTTTGGPPVVVPPIGHGPGGGQFIVQCNEPVRSAAFDPIVYPGRDTAGHNHEFYGNRTINPDSTFGSLEGSSTACDENADTAGYWHPTVYSNGVRHVAPKSTFYYDSPISGPVHSYPSGLQMVAGDSKATSPQDTHVVYWGCGSGSGQSSLDSPPKCSGGDLTIHVIFPNCWDGRNLDTDDQGHVAYGRDGCPSSHPVAIPRLTMRIQYNDWNPDPGSLSLSSGSIDSMHADFFQAWEPRKLSKAVDLCINAGKDCTADEVIGL